MLWLDAMAHVLALAPAVLAVGLAILAVTLARRTPLTASARPAHRRTARPDSDLPPAVRANDPDAPGHARPRAPSPVSAAA
ncbi:MAG: hypothetical protein AUI10_05570 [Actinobacteria bacterium 13_2_20CM_2_72_6]|nr:MAG: hypothetical protein AUI10_05570 [Actinobacteria bacterium 13_2_20CM_2_72_6]